MGKVTGKNKTHTRDGSNRKCPIASIDMIHCDVSLHVAITIKYHTKNVLNNVIHTTSCQMMNDTKHCSIFEHVFFVCEGIKYIPFIRTQKQKQTHNIEKPKINTYQYMLMMLHLVEIELTMHQFQIMIYI